MSSFLSFLSLSVIFGLTLSCDPPNCNNVDCGTCVEACCRLTWNVTGINALQFTDGLMAALKSGGPDNQYEYWGTVPNQGKYTYVVQGIHFTSTVHYNDTINFGVMAVDGTHCNVDAFSHSQDFINGDFAYCDAGQNYKNLVTILDAFKDTITTQQTIVFGCPNPN